ncbi:LOB domain-containing protein 6-like [Phalaenopsis equestris]|uniref:LOB domain-containing protein 6-like n=1 Tax=Phalaenopsis equestris TaxID=78828 RepID=UPI0009E45DB5|nr:LOB domain-containing protein 6-like [Phalaenopsis equestris]
MTSLTPPSSFPPTSPPPPPSSASGGSATASSPCAACKFLRRKCQPDCVFAPYFLADQPQKFISVHRVFGASNVTKLLKEIPQKDREDAVNSLAYEADMRIRDPVYGCVGVISILHHELRKLQLELSFARSELARYQFNPPQPSADLWPGNQFGFDATASVGFGMNVGGNLIFRAPSARATGGDGVGPT